MIQMSAKTVPSAPDTSARVVAPFVGAAFDVVAVASSAGGVRALLEVVAGLPLGFPAAIIVLQHLDPHHRSMLAEILGRHARLPVTEARAGEVLRPGALVVAPPDRHLVVETGLVLRLTETGLVSFVRPAADVLFESVAAVCARRALAVVLTGSGRDGTAGVRAIKDHGGTVLVQDPASAEFPSMPLAAIQAGCVDKVLALDQITPEIVRLVQTGDADA
jgi:two-component system chemotaxis response regulator CheB